MTGNSLKWRAFDSAAKSLAAADVRNYDAQYAICAEYGIFLDQCTDDEIKYLESLTSEYIGGSY